MQQHNIPKAVQQNLLSPNSAVPVEQVFGGLSGAVVYRCTSQYGPACLRAWPPGQPSDSTRLAIRIAIATAHAAGLHYVPKFYLARDQQSYYRDGTRMWDLSEWLPGSANYLDLPNPAKLQAAMQALARLHLAWSHERQFGISPAAAERLSLLTNWLARGATLPIREYVVDDVEYELCQACLRALRQLGHHLLEELRAISSQKVKLQLVLRDIWSDHVLFSGLTVTGVIDFGAMRVDEPATDVARLLGSLEPHSLERWRQGLDFYRELNADVDPRRVVVLDQVSCLLSALQWMQWLVIERRQFEASTAQLIKRWDGFLQRLSKMHHPPTMNQVGS